MKKFLSSILVFSIVFGTTIPSAQALESSSKISLESNQIEEIAEGTFVLRDAADSNSYVEARDLENGDTQFIQYVDNVMVSKYIVRHEKASIDATYITDGSIQHETIQVPQKTNMQRASAYGTTSGRLGRIRYQYADGANAGICGAYVDYVKNTGSKKYDINGTYRDLAGLASFVSMILALPVTPALVVSKAVLGYFSIATATANFVIPACDLQSDYTEIEYTLTNMSNSKHKNSFYGTHYKITAPGKNLNNEYVEGTYFPTSSWGNTLFGTTIYPYLFAYSSWNIYAWN